MPKFSFHRLFLVALLVLLLGNFGSLQAQKNEDPCVDSQNIQEDQFCAGYKLELAEDTLNQLWSQLMKEVPEAIAARLKTQQEHWIAFRDEQCKLMRDAYASPGLMRWFVCTRQMTEQRTEHLRDIQEAYGIHDE